MSVSISREKTVFYAALDVADPAQRRQFLDQACASDAELRAAVEELLAVHAGSEQFFGDCASSLMILPADEIELLPADEIESAAALAAAALVAAALTAGQCDPAFQAKPRPVIGS